MKYLTTLDLDDDWLDALAKACPELEIRRYVVTDPGGIPAGVWAETEILHTGAVLPHLAQVPALRWVQLDTAGVEYVVGHEIWGSDVLITTLGGIAPVPMAEYVVMAILALAHHQPQLEAIRRTRRWPSGAERLAGLTPLPVDGANLTILGYGRIGQEVARATGGLGIRVTGVTRRGVADRPVTDTFRASRRLTSPAGAADAASASQTEVVALDALDDVLAETDYLVVLTPLTEATRGLIGVERLAKLKAGACIVNASRGGIVDERALDACLTSRHLTYAYLDVFDDEPLPPDSRWWDHPYAVVTPHVAGLAPRYAEHVLDLVSANVIRYQEGKPLLNRADRATGY